MPSRGEGRGGRFDKRFFPFFRACKRCELIVIAGTERNSIICYTRRQKRASNKNKAKIPFWVSDLLFLRLDLTRLSSTFSVAPQRERAKSGYIAAVTLRTHTKNDRTLKTAGRERRKRILRDFLSYLFFSVAVVLALIFRGHYDRPKD